MTVKIPTIDQHQPLHDRWPTDCCLCKAEERIRGLEKQLEEAEEMIRALQNRNKDTVAEYQRMMDDIYLRTKDDIIEDCATIADGWDFGNPIAEEIRKMKEG